MAGSLTERGSGEPVPVPGETADARLRRIVAEIKADHAEDLEGCFRVWVANLRNEKVSAGERRKNAEAIARHLDPQRAPTVTNIDARTQAVTVNQLDGVDVTRWLSEVQKALGHGSNNGNGNGHV